MPTAGHSESNRAAATAVRCLIAGVGHRFWRDFSAGVVFADRLAERDWPRGVRVEDYGFHALAMTQNLQDERPERAVFVAAEQRGRRPGALSVARFRAARPAPATVQAHIGEAGAGVVALDHLLVIAGHFDALPAETWVVELEPVDTGWGDGLSDAVAGMFPAVADAVTDIVAGRPPRGTERSP